MRGMYVGWFKKVPAANSKARDNKINIIIEKINGNTVSGRSIVAGNERPFQGPFTTKGNTYTVKASEPGDDRYDGVFTFTVKTNERKLAGIWVPNKPTASVSRTEYTLDRTEFVYRSDLELPENLNWTELYGDEAKRVLGFDGAVELLTEDVTRFNASKVLLKKEYLENLHKGDLEVLRNSIYARHGYSFKNRKMRYVFDQIDWYVPVSTDVRSKLTKLELQNIEAIKRYEKHAEAYYDGFGR